MNSTKRLLTTLSHQIPDRVPWSLLVNSYFLDVQEGKYNKMNPMDFLKQIGADGMSWINLNALGTNVKVNTYVDGTLFRVQEGGNWFSEVYDYLFLDYYKGEDGRVVEREYITPVGRLSAKFIFKASSNSVFVSQFPIKRLKDYNVLIYMINDLTYDIAIDSLQKENQRMEQGGLVVVMLHATPVYELIWYFMGLEGFHYFFHDYRNETLELMDSMANKYFECYKLYAKAPVPAIIIPEDAGTTLYSPRFFDEHMKPVIRRYCEIAKGGGKIPIIHACGHLKGLVRSLLETGVECVESMSPPPTGNVSVSEFKKDMPGVCVMGGIPANVFRASLSDFTEYVKGLLLENMPGGNFVLSSGDSVPGDARMANIEIIPELVERYGRY